MITNNSTDEGRGTSMKAQLRSLISICGVLVSVSHICASKVTAQEGRDSGKQVLKQVAEIPLPGPAVRFDYQSLDAKHGRLYIAHMNADQIVVFDTHHNKLSPTSMDSSACMV